MKNKRKRIVSLIVFIISIISFIYVFNMIFDNDNYKKKNDGPKSYEPYQHKKEIQNNYNDEKNVELKYDDYIVASGYAGAADNVYYTRNHTLYHLRLSTNETIRVAEGIKKIEESTDFIKAYKGRGFNIIAEDDYVKYVD